MVSGIYGRQWDDRFRKDDPTNTYVVNEVNLVLIYLDRDKTPNFCMPEAPHLRQTQQLQAASNSSPLPTIYKFSQLVPFDCPAIIFGTYCPSEQRNSLPNYLYTI